MNNVRKFDNEMVSNIQYFNKNLFITKEILEIWKVNVTFALIDTWNCPKNMLKTSVTTYRSDSWRMRFAFELKDSTPPRGRKSSLVIVSTMTQWDYYDEGVMEKLLVEEKWILIRWNRNFRIYWKRSKNLNFRLCENLKNVNSVECSFVVEK